MCGAVVGFIRRPYETTIRFRKGDPSSDVRVAYFFAPKGTPTWNHPTYMTPRYQDQITNWSGLGEVPGSKRKYLPSTFSLDVEDGCVPGPVDWFHNGFPDTFLFQCSARANLQCSTELVADAKVFRNAAINMHSAARVTARGTRGAFGAATLRSSANVGLRANERLAASANLRCSSSLVARGQKSFFGLAQLRCSSSLVASGRKTLLANSTLRCVSTVTATSSSSSPPVPGSSCSTAGLLTLGITYEFTIAPMAQQWFKINVTNGVTYRCRYVFVSGDSFCTGAFLHGSCPSPNTWGSLTISGCASGTAGAGEDGFIQMFGGFSSSTTYAITPDIGGCP